MRFVFKGLFSYERTMLFLDLPIIKGTFYKDKVFILQ